MSVSSDEITHVASLARIAVPEARIPGLVGELNRILAHMDVLQRVDITAVTAAGETGDAMRLRDDVHMPGTLTEARRAFAPECRDGFFLVPRLESHGDVGSVTSGDDA